MTDAKPQNPPDDAPSFPYQVLWAGYGNAQVTLRELESNAEEYGILNETAAVAKRGVPTIEFSQVESLIKEHGFAKDYAKQFWLICCFYLAPTQAEAFGIDPKQSREVLSQAVVAAQRLDQVLDNLPPKVVAAMFYKRPFVAEVEKPKGPDFWALQPELRDFILVAGETAEELRNVEGRPRNHHRNSMIRMFLEVMDEKGLDDLKVSDGTKKRSEPHLSGRAGRLLMGLVSLVEPNWQEEWLAPKVKPILREFRQRKTREKTHVDLG